MNVSARLKAGFIEGQRPDLLKGGVRPKAGFIEVGCKAKGRIYRSGVQGQRPDLLKVGARPKAGFVEGGCKAKGRIR